ALLQSSCILLSLHDALPILGGPTVMGLPLIKGPYGRITALNLNTGEQTWMIPNGKPADNLVNNPALKAEGIDASNWGGGQRSPRSEEHTSELQSQSNLVCRL